MLQEFKRLSDDYLSLRQHFVALPLLFKKEWLVLYTCTPHTGLDTLQYWSLCTIFLELAQAPVGHCQQCSIEERSFEERSCNPYLCIFVSK